MEKTGFFFFFFGGGREKKEGGWGQRKCRTIKLVVIFLC